MSRPGYQDPVKKASRCRFERQVGLAGRMRVVREGVPLVEAAFLLRQRRQLEQVLVLLLGPLIESLGEAFLTLLENLSDGHRLPLELGRHGLTPEVVVQDLGAGHSETNETFSSLERFLLYQIVISSK